MSEKTLQDHVSIMYKRLRYARMKAVLLAVVVYLCLLILSFSFLRRSDHVTYVIILCGAAALILALAWMCRICIRDLKNLDQIMLQQCDPVTYLDIIKYAVSYGKNIRLRALQVTVFK